jgi:hypothetical protein
MRKIYIVVSSLTLLISASSAGAEDKANVDGGTVFTRVAVASDQAVAGSDDFGRLSDAQLRARSGALHSQLDALAAEMAKRKGQKTKLATAQDGLQHQSTGGAPTKRTPSATGDTARFQKIWLREYGYPNEVAATPPAKPAPTDPCDPQRLFIRANSLDNYLYGITPASKAKGLTVSYTDDRLAGTQKATINGMISYVALRDLCPVTPPGDGPFFSGYVVAPFVLGQGDYNQPRIKTENSSLKFGVENQLEVSRGLFPRQVFTLAPYVQTDYRGLARAGGASFYLDSYDPNLHLGGYIDTNPYLGWFLQLRGEADAVDVSAVGVTNLKKTDYEWFGGTARLNMYFLPADLSVPDWIRNRFALYASASYFADARSGMNVHMYTANLSYKISSDGASSISFEYDQGTDKDTLVAAKKYLVSLGYAY